MRTIFLAILLILLVYMPEYGSHAQGINNDNELEMIGKLQKTVEPEVWMVTDSDNVGSYLLLNAKCYTYLPWFKEGKEVYIKGQICGNRTSGCIQAIPVNIEEIKPVIRHKKRAYTRKARHFH